MTGDQVLDLTDGYEAVISVESSPDDSPMPFILKPMVDDNIEDVGGGMAQDLSNNAGDFPTTTVSVVWRRRLSTAQEDIWPPWLRSWRLFASRRP